MSSRNPVIPQRVAHLLERLWNGQKDALREEPIGLCLYGSLAWGDFDLKISDIDLVCTLHTGVNEEALERLRVMHAALAEEFPEWEDRVEVQYVAKEALINFREMRHSMANISPGEPLHIIDAGKEWLSNWYMARTYGIAIKGPEPREYIPAIAQEEFYAAIRDYAEEWQSHVVNTMSSRPYQSYGVLTMCRALYTLTHNRQTSKREAAMWARKTYPEFAAVIADALRWREDGGAAVDPLESYPRVEAAIHGLYKYLPQS